MRYQAHKRRRRVKKKQACDGKLQTYQLKLVKKAYVALLEHLFKAKKVNIIESTVLSFRSHQLSKKTFRILKIAYLNQKKSNILNKVARDFRDDRIHDNRAFVNPTIALQLPNERHLLKASDQRVTDKMLLQKVYTTWLQYTLDVFIKKKVLHRFQEYQAQKLKDKVFRILRGARVGKPYMAELALAGVCMDNNIYEF